MAVMGEFLFIVDMHKWVNFHPQHTGTKFYGSVRQSLKCCFSFLLFSLYAAAIDYCCGTVVIQTREFFVLFLFVLAFLPQYNRTVNNELLCQYSFYHIYALWQ